MDNTIKRICSEVVYSEKVRRISDMKWAGQKHKAYTGICQFCNNPLKYSHRVLKESDVVLPVKEGSFPPSIMVDTGSPGEIKAQGYLDNNSAPEGTHVFALSSCDVMTEEDLFYIAMEHYDKRVDDWREEVKAKAAARVERVESPATIKGRSW